MKIRLNIFITMISLLSCSIVYGKAIEPIQWVASDTTIKNLKIVLDEIKNSSPLKVFFPTKIPKTATVTLYATNESHHPNANLNQQWMLAVNSSPDCKMKNCRVGTMTATLNEPLEKEYLQPPFPNRKKKAKEKVILSNHVIAYFTPAHAEADWHPAQIEWQTKNVLYRLSWDTNNFDKKLLTIMANSSFKNY